MHSAITATQAKRATAEGPLMHPDLLAALADDRRKFCRCGAITGHRHCALWPSQNPRLPTRGPIAIASRISRGRRLICAAFLSVLRMIGIGADG